MSAMTCNRCGGELRQTKRASSVDTREEWTCYKCDNSHPCSVCGKEIIVGPGITDPKGISVRCPYLDWEWHKEAAADIDKQHPTLHKQWERKHPLMPLTASADPVNHPTHYGGDVPHEVIKCLAAWGLESDALLWNAVKYIARAGKKGPAVEDLRKAIFYVNARIAALGAK